MAEEMINWALIAEILQKLLADSKGVQQFIRNMERAEEESILEPEMVEAPQNSLGVGGGALIQFVAQVNSVSDAAARYAYVSRMIPASSTSTPWGPDPNIGNFIAFVPQNVAMPDVGDVVLVTFTGVSSVGAIYGLFGAGGGGSVTQYRYKEMFGDYYRCRTWDGTTEGDEDVYVSKPPYLRRSPFDGQTVNGLNYSYTSNTERIVDDGGDNVAVQVVVPYFVEDDIIYAADLSSGVTGVTDAGTPIDKIDTNVDGRFWLRNG